MRLQRNPERQIADNREITALFCIVFFIIGLILFAVSRSLLFLFYKHDSGNGTGDHNHRRGCDHNVQPRAAALFPFPVRFCI